MSSRGARRSRRSPTSAFTLAILTVLAGTGACGGPSASPVAPVIKLDNFGYRPGAVKVAIVTADPGRTVEIRDANDAVVFTVPRDGGAILYRGRDRVFSGDEVWWVDFTAFARPGSYRLYSPALRAGSYGFDIRDAVYDVPLRASLRTFFYQRCNAPKPATHAGRWSDEAACHLEDRALGPARDQPDHGRRDLTGGWHDAGDYNKFVRADVVEAVLPLLRVFEDHPAVFRDGDLGIPESGNGVPDLLDELRWELDWLLRMQLPDGSVLSRVEADGYATSAPPSADRARRAYHGPSVEATAVVAGLGAAAARAFAAAGVDDYAGALRTAALRAWTWLERKPERDPLTVWAAAEIQRTVPSAVSAARYVAAFHPHLWAGVALAVDGWDTQAAFTYVRGPVSDPDTAANIGQAIDRLVDGIFREDDLYRNGMAYWAYHWGSNRVRAKRGLALLMAARLGRAGVRTPQDLVDHAEDFLHYFHGQNPLAMMFLTNMAAMGGEHSSFQFYHSWFGNTRDARSLELFIGKPASVSEPAYPYFRGTDNLGVRDDRTSTLGPAPGFVTGGPNKGYTGVSAPPRDAQHVGRFYRDWAELDTAAAARVWEISENSIASQGTYAALVAHFTAAAGRPSPKEPRPAPLTLPSPRPPARVASLQSFEGDGRGAWSGDRAQRRLVTREAGAPQGAVTDGATALEACMTRPGPWQDGFAKLTGFEPRQWRDFDRLALDLFVAPGVFEGDWHEVALFGDSPTVSYARLSSHLVPLLRGPNAVSFPLDFPDVIRPSDPLTAVYFVITAERGGAGCVYLDRVRLEGERPSTAAATRLAYHRGGVVRGRQDRKEIALLFSGAAHAEGAPAILDALKGVGGRASFFFTGDFLRTPSFAPFIRRARAEGHYVGPHSDRHLLYASWEEVPKLLVSPETFHRDLDRNFAELERLGIPRRQARIFLPPFEHYTQEIADWSARRGLIVIQPTPGTFSHTDYLPDDAGQLVPAPAIVRSILVRDVEPDGLNGFLLAMHVGAGPGRTRDRLHQHLDSLLRELSQRGYRFVRVDELIETP